MKRLLCIGAALVALAAPAVAQAHGPSSAGGFVLKATGAYDAPHTMTTRAVCLRGGSYRLRVSVSAQDDWSAVWFYAALRGPRTIYVYEPGTYSLRLPAGVYFLEAGGWDVQWSTALGATR